MLLVVVIGIILQEASNMLDLQVLGIEDMLIPSEY
jgi:hypothetical protein